MARGKLISDETALDSLLDTLMQTGPDGLTFSRAAKGCGLSPATLVQRFGNREGLVQTILLRAWDRLDQETEVAHQAEPHTVEGAIRLLMRLMPPDAAERNAADGLLLLREDFRNPVLRARGAAWGKRLAEVLGGRLTNDPERRNRLGWQMARAWQGAHTWWAFTRERPAGEAIREALEEWAAGMQ